MKTRYLTKSRFKTAYECPRKLYYVDHPEYGNTMRESDFMAALAEGGFQVGALAKIYYEGGVDLEEFHGDEAVRRTEELLKQKNVTIYEAAIQVDHLLIRIDVLEKKGSSLNLIEVKAKSYDFEESDFFKTKRGKTERGSELKSEWEPYLVDVAFQSYVLRKKFSNLKVIPYLYLIDKRAHASVDGLHQKFLLEKVNGRSKVKVAQGLLKSMAGATLLSLIDVTKEVDFLIENDVFPGATAPRLPEYVDTLSSQMITGGRGDPRPSTVCKGCEFRIPKNLEAKGFKSGFKECWTELGLLDFRTVDEPTVFELWDNRRTETHLSENKIFLKDLTIDDLVPKNPKQEEGSGLSRVERQLLQTVKTKASNPKIKFAPYVNHEYLEEFFSGLKYPFHFIDFETTRTAIPFHKDMRPYEQLAYQFSHHTMDVSGKVTHQTQYLHVKPGEFPNFKFARALFDALKCDDGTVFRYAPHENTVLNDILRQLEVFHPDTDHDLKEFILSLTSSGKRGTDGYREGQRVMRDLCPVVKKSFYALPMGGSNSIKVVTPTILGLSKILQEKYSKPIYGKGAPIQSLNFEPLSWVRFNDDGSVLDPYKTLPPVELDLGFSLTDIEQINEGGGASIAWARMQFTEMNDSERNALANGLLRYCELDTLSMVWLVEFLKSEIEI